MVCGPNTMAVESSCWLASPFFELVVPKGMFTAVVGYILWMYTDIYRSIDPAQPGSVPQVRYPGTSEYIAYTRY